MIRRAQDDLSDVLFGDAPEQGGLPVESGDSALGVAVGDAVHEEVPVRDQSDDGARRDFFARPVVVRVAVSSR